MATEENSKKDSEIVVEGFFDETVYAEKNIERAPYEGNGKVLINSLIWNLIGLIIGVALIILCIYFVFADSQVFIGAICLALGFLISSGCVKNLKNRVKEISKEMNKEKSFGVNHSKKKITKICIGIVSFFVVGALFAGIGYGISESIKITDYANRLLQKPIDENIFEEIAEFDKYYTNKSALGKMFFTKKEAVDSFKAQANELVENRAKEIEEGIRQLKKITEIKSKEEYNKIVETYNSLRLSPNDEFDSCVKERVSNYSEFEVYDSDFQVLCKKYEVTKNCGSCSGRGKFSCSSCGGAGKKLVTWYSEGDWGEKSYTSYTCTSCNGQGKRSCSSCGGDGKNTYLEFGK